MKQSIWFVILTYQEDREKLLKYLQAFKRFSYVLVNNNEMAYEYPRDISVIKTKKNLGYTGGMNKGIQYSLDQGATWIVVMNDDLRLSKQSLKLFVKRLQQAPSGVMGPFVGIFDNSRWTTVYPAKNQIKDEMYFSGSCLAIHRDVIEEIGIFYEPYFIYYEDTEICIRAKKAGFILSQIFATISHDDGTTFGSGSFLHQYYLARNHLLFVERNAPVRVKLYEFLRLPKTLWEHWSKKEIGALIGIRDYFLRRFGKYQPL